MRTHSVPPCRRPRRGGALVGVTLMIVVLATLSYSTLALSGAAAREHKGQQSETAAHYISSAGLSAAVQDLRAGGQGAVGSADAPVEFAGGTYFVERAGDDGGPFSIVSTGRRDGSTVRTQVVLRAEQTGMFRWGAFGEEELLIDQNASVDSYDSSLGSYVDQAVNGSNGHAYARTRGNVGSNGDILLRQNSRVYGDALPGPTRTTTVTGNAILTGSSTPSSVTLELPPIDVPGGLYLGPLHAVGGTTTVLPAGSFVFGTMTMDPRSQIVAVGPATLVFESFEVAKNSRFLVDATAGPVGVYVKHDFTLSSNALVGAKDRDPRNLSFHLLSDNIIDPDQEVDLDQIDLESNSELYGTIYAPTAAIDVNSNFTLHGSIVAKRLLLRSFSQLHYDENLARGSSDEEVTYEVVGWRVLPDRAQDDTDGGSTRNGTDGDRTPSTTEL